MGKLSRKNIGTSIMIHPNHINALIDFYPGTTPDTWQYDLYGKDMRSLQINGAAHLYNLLQQPPHLALLADEVGMGKTIQALSVITALLLKNPKAKILILAPRDEIVRNWEKEYQNFISRHYRHTDDCIKTALGGEPRQKMVYCRNLYSLVHEVNQGWAQLFIGKISSFSSLFSSKDIGQKLKKLGIEHNMRFSSQKTNMSPDQNRKLASLLQGKIISHAVAEKPYFDLLVIDEAHFFRRKQSGSLRVEVAKQFFGDPEVAGSVKLAQKVLLMTATPNHSSGNDILNMVSYFATDFQGKSYQDVLNQICVRRLRRLGEGTHAKNKYNYREEKPSPSDFKGNPLAETFFALYQHELAKQAKKHSGTSKAGSASMIKYLEGLEFIPHEMANDTTNEEEKRNSTDFRKGEDTAILVNLSQRFRKIFNEHPNHPKYDKLIEDLTQEGVHEKAVVFVRRIPSVKEITQRVLAKYDEQLWKQLGSDKHSRLKLENLNRASFNKYSKSNLIDAEDEDAEEDQKVINAQNPQDGIPESKVLNLFKILKSDKEDARTAAANFRLRFNASKPSIFALFFSPAADYDKEPYQNLQLFKFEIGKKELDHYYRSAVIHRCIFLQSKAQKKSEADEIRNILVETKALESKPEEIPHKIETFFSIFWEVIQNDKGMPTDQKDSLRKAYLDLTFYERESLGKFIEKGTLLASEAVVWMFQLYESLDVNSNKQLDEYQAFVSAFKKTLPHKRFYEQTQDSILHFRTISTKVVTNKSDHNPIRKDWEMFNNAQPVYPYSADNKNTGVREAFNTPFFPDYLVATSVLQEGVNLQYFCKRMYHYGMAWTPGDNEQRIGRIDRMFGQIERELTANSDSKLPIYYPYLKDTIDEEQLARFAKRKYHEEGLIDLGMAPNEGADYSLEDNLNDDWQEYLRLRPTNEEIADPFPVKIDAYQTAYRTIEIPSNEDHRPLVEAIANTLRKANGSPEVEIREHPNQFSILVNPDLLNGRKQPVMVDFLYDAVGSGSLGQPVYCLRMKTPLAPANKLKEFQSKFFASENIQANYPYNVKLCFDPGKEVGSYWSIHMCTDLPFFTNSSINPLSAQEVLLAFESLIRSADLTEREIFEDQDLDLTSLNMSMGAQQTFGDHQLRSGDISVLPEGWEMVGEFYLRENAHSQNDLDLKNILLTNHAQLYTRLHKKADKVYIQTVKHVHDIQRLELNLLNFHHEVFIRQVKWEQRTENDVPEDE